MKYFYCFLSCGEVKEIYDKFLGEKNEYGRNQKEL